MVRPRQARTFSCFSLLWSVALARGTWFQRAGSLWCADLASWRPTIWAHQTQANSPHSPFSSSDCVHFYNNKTTPAVAPAASPYLFGQVADVFCFFFEESRNSLQYTTPEISFSPPSHKMCLTQVYNNKSPLTLFVDICFLSALSSVFWLD